MAKFKEISLEKRAQIVILRKTGLKHREIADTVGVSKTGLATALARYEETKSNTNKKRCGRPRKTTKNDDQYIQMISTRNRFKTAPDIRAEVNNCLPQPISVSTVRNRLREKGLNGHVALRKPLLRPINKRKRSAFAKKYQNWTVDQWKSVLWTDESKFEIFGTHRRQYVRRKVGERFNPTCILPTVKHGGGSVMVWGSFSYDGVGELVKIDGIMKKESYHRILQNSAIPSGIGLIGYGFVFQQDNDPKHTSRMCRNYLESKEREGVLEIMGWPPQSPDLNPIELLWEELDRQVREHRPTNQKHLWEILKRCWDNLKNETLQKLVERLPRICAAIISAKGGHFDEKCLNTKT